VIVSKYFLTKLSFDPFREVHKEPAKQEPTILMLFLVSSFQAAQRAVRTTKPRTCFWRKISIVRRCMQLHANPCNLRRYDFWTKPSFDPLSGVDSLGEQDRRNRGGRIGLSIDLKRRAGTARPTPIDFGFAISFTGENLKDNLAAKVK
jgi:hypothetical protein